MIVQTIDFYQFREAFIRMDRIDTYSREGLELLFDYLEDMSESMDTPVELDVISICCEYDEYTTEEIIQNYALQDDTEEMDEDEKKEYVREYLEDNTCIVGETGDSFIYQVF